MKRLFIQVASVGACESNKTGQDPSMVEEIVEKSDDDDMMTRSTEEFYRKIIFIEGVVKYGKILSEILL